MAGALLDDLIDALSSDDDQSSSDKEMKRHDSSDEKHMTLNDALYDPEDFARRQIMMNSTPPPPQPDATLNPEDQLDFYRRMVQMQENMMNNDDGDGSGTARSVNSIRACSAFTRAGQCNEGTKCEFIHDGAFKKSGLINESRMTVDPEDFIRRALQMRTKQRTNKQLSSLPGSSSEPWIPFLGI